MMTVEEALTHLGEPVTDELREFAEATSRGFLWKSKLEGRVRTYTCSLCGMQWDYDDRYPADVYQADCFQGNLSQWTRVSCPNCERSLDVYEEWRGVNKVGYKEHFVEQWRRSASEKDVVVAVGATARRVWHEPGTIVDRADVRVASFAVYRFGRAAERFVCEANGQFRRMTKLNHLDANQRCSQRELDEDSVNEAIRGTGFERVWLDQLMRTSHYGATGLNSPVLKMSWLSTHPSVEYMIKLGFEQLVIDRFTLAYPDAAINWSGKTMEEVFGMDRATVKALRPYGAKELGYNALMGFKTLRGALTWPVPRIMEAVINLHIGAHEAVRLRDAAKDRGYQLQTEIKYLLAQTKKRRPVRTHDLIDYWRQCDQLQVPADDYRARHPKDFHEQHAEFSGRVRYKSDDKLDEAIAGRLRQYEDELGFEGCGLILRPAQSTNEVIREGSRLHHCVGGYCRQYASGNTVILVLRREEEPDRPWHTVEMTPDGRLIQCRGAYNQTGEADRPLIDAFWAAYRAAKGKGYMRTA